MKKLTWIALAMTGLFGIVSHTNDLTVFIQTLKTSDNLNWTTIISTIGQIGLLIMLLYFAWKINSVADFLEAEKIELKEYQSLKKSNEELTEFNKRLTATVKYDQEFTIIGHRIVRDIIIPSMAYTTDENKEILAENLYKLHFIAPELVRYGLPQEIVDKVLRMYHEDEAKKKSGK